MKDFLLSSAYFPPVEYFAFLTGGNVFLDRCEKYRKQSYRNRTVIMNGNGPLNLIIPTVHDFRMGKVEDVRIDNSVAWQRTHLRSIESAYNNSPYYLYYKDFITPFFEEKYDFLFDLNLKITKQLAKIIGIECEINVTDNFKEYSDHDLRLLIQPKNAKCESDYDYFLKDPYYQVFKEKFGFISNLSILDLLFNEGPMSKEYLQKAFSTFAQKTDNE